MKIKEYGKTNEKIIVLFHPSCMTWEIFRNLINEMKDNYHLIVPVMPGYDFEDKSDYTSVEEIVTGTENWLFAHGYPIIDLLYGLSMGGACAIRFLASQRIQVKKAVIDAGITPYQLPYMITRLIAQRDFIMISMGKSRTMLTKVYSEQKYGKDNIDYAHKVLLYMSPKTIWRTFDSCNNYKMPKTPLRLNTCVSYWFGSEEQKERKLDIKYVKYMFPGIKFRRINGMEHGEYLSLHAKELAHDLERCLK